VLILSQLSFLLYNVVLQHLMMTRQAETYVKYDKDTEAERVKILTFKF
jgi:hypothetical protein